MAQDGAEKLRAHMRARFLILNLRSTHVLNQTLNGRFLVAIAVLL